MMQFGNNVTPNVTLGLLVQFTSDAKWLHNSPSLGGLCKTLCVAEKLQFSFMLLFCNLASYLSVLIKRVYESEIMHWQYVIGFISSLSLRQYYKTKNANNTLTNESHFPVHSIRHRHNATNPDRVWKMLSSHQNKLLQQKTRLSL